MIIRVSRLYKYVKSWYRIYYYEDEDFFILYKLLFLLIYILKFLFSVLIKLLFEKVRIYVNVYVIIRFYENFFFLKILILKIYDKFVLKKNRVKSDIKNILKKDKF